MTATALAHNSNRFTAMARVAPEEAAFRPALPLPPLAGAFRRSAMNDEQPTTLPDNVNGFLFKASDVYGKFKAEEFSQFMWTMSIGIRSPIEQLFLIAMYLVAEFNYVTLSIVQSFEHDNDDLLIIPQWQAGKYRIDFALRRHPIDRIVCVELDGHDFHDRDERQRRYEKARDRFLTAEGYSVLHFTGAEIVKDPCAAALEAFILATGLRNVATNPFDSE